MIFADKLIRLRKKSGMSQEELADKLDVSRQSVSKWESAQCLPDLSKLVSISKIFDVSLDYLIKEDEGKEDFVNETVNEEVVKKAAERAVSYARFSMFSLLRKALALILLCVSPFVMIFLRRDVRLSAAGFEDIYGEWEGVVDQGVFEQWQNMFDYTIGIGYNEAMKKGVVAFVILAIVGVAIAVYDFVRSRAVVFAEETDAESKKTLYSGRDYCNTNLILLVSSAVVGIVAVVPSIVASFTSFSEEGGVAVCLLLSAASALLFCFAEKRIETAVRFGVRKVVGNGVSASDKATICSAYWMTVIFVYFVWNVCDFDNSTSWVILPVASVISAFAFAVPDFIKERVYIKQK